MALPSNLAEITASDIYLGPIMSELLLCLCEKAQLVPNPPEHCTFRIGGDVPHDMGLDGDLCCEGFAYVTLGDIYPSTESFPEQDIVRQVSAGCAWSTWAVSLRAAIVRCAPTGGPTNGLIIPNADWEAAALQGIYDTRTLQRTACCFRDYVVRESTVLLGMSVVVDRILQGTPFGGCIERSVNFTVQVPNCDC